MAFRRIAISLYLFCSSMISAQTLRVCREGKPVSTFPDHASVSPTASASAIRDGRRADMLRASTEAEKTRGDALQPGERVDHAREQRSPEWTIARLEPD